MNRPVVIGLVVFLFVLTIVVLIVRHGQVHHAGPAAGSATTDEKGNGESSQRRIHVKLFFNESDSDYLAAEDRAVAYKETLHDQAVEVLKELVAGPQSKLVAIMPQGTTLREVFVTKDGTAYVDFSPELTANVEGGSQVEINTVYSIVNTLTLNFPTIKRVQVLVDGRMVPTLNGHLDLSRPLKQDLSLVRNKEDQGVVQPAASRQQS